MVSAMIEEENQMALFEEEDLEPDLALALPKELPPPALPTPAPALAKPARTKRNPAPVQQTPAPIRATPAPTAKPARKVKEPEVVVMSAPAAKKVSGLVPDGDVRLTANVRQDLHLKLKIASAHRRTTIGEIIEELIDRHL
jgi:hypothetical protein